MGGARTSFFSQWNNGNMMLVDQALTTGNVFFVDSGNTTKGGATAGYGTSPDAPFLTLDAAIGNCTANNGDIIFVLPGHAETIIADSGVDIDQAGITVIGLGSGAARPTFTFQGNVAADFKLAAASTVIKNLLFLNNLDNTTGIVEVSAADCKILGCEFRELNPAAFADVLLLTTTAAHRLEVADCLFLGNDGNGAVSLAQFVGSDDLHMHHCHLEADCTAGLIGFIGGASLRVHLHDLQLYNEDNTAGADAIQGIIDTITGSTGIIGPNIEVFLNLNAANVSGGVVGATFHCFRPIHVANVAGEGAMPIDRVDSTDV